MSPKALTIAALSHASLMTTLALGAPVPQVTMEIREKISDARHNAVIEEKMLQREALARSLSRLPLDAREAVKRREATAASASERILLAQATSTDTPPEIVPPGVAKPLPLAPATAAPKAKAGPKPAVIDSESSFIDSANSITIFEGSVRAKHPDFDLTCDKLEIHMPKQDKKTKPGPALAGGSKLDPTKVPVPPSTPEPAPAPAAAPEGGGIDKAIATGTKVVIVQHSPDGTNKTGTGRHVTYDGKTGDITLRGMPQVQNGDSMIIATSAETVLVITAGGRVITKGPHQTKFVQAQDKPKAKAAPPPSNPVPVSGPGVLPPVKTR